MGLMKMSIMPLFTDKLLLITHYPILTDINRLSFRHTNCCRCKLPGVLSIFSFNKPLAISSETPQHNIVQLHTHRHWPSVVFLLWSSRDKNQCFSSLRDDYLRCIISHVQPIQSLMAWMRKPKTTALTPALTTMYKYTTPNEFSFAFVFTFGPYSDDGKGKKTNWPKFIHELFRLPHTSAIIHHDIDAIQRQIVLCLLFSLVGHQIHYLWRLFPPGGHCRLPHNYTSLTRWRWT
jgi:hypothetical protein